MPLILALLLLAAPLSAEVRSALHYNRYRSNSGVQVQTPAFELGLDYGARTQLALRYDLDAVSAASFDQARSKTHKGVRPPGTCWSCHPGTDALSGATALYSETRHGAEFKVTRNHEDVSYSAGYKLNRENDYASDGASLGWQGSAFQQNSTLSLGVNFAKDRVGSSTRALSQELQTQGADLNLTQVLSPSTVLMAGYSYGAFYGYQQNPYAFVQIGADTGRPLRAEHPSLRTRHVGVASLKQGLPWEAAAQADYRYYSDDWGVLGQSAELALSKEFWGFVLEPSARWYVQSSGAWFFRNFYAAPEAYRSRDLKLAPHSTRLLSLALRTRISEHWGSHLVASLYERADSLDYSLYYADKPESASMVQLVLVYD